jgi:hypothetical protein
MLAFFLGGVRHQFELHGFVVLSGLAMSLSRKQKPPTASQSGGLGSKSAVVVFNHDFQLEKVFC